MNSIKTCNNIMEKEGKRYENQKKGFEQIVSYFLGTTITSLAVIVTAISVNSACIYIMHQPKLPESAKKMRKF